MNINHGIQIYAPGQIWRMRLEKESTAFVDNKYRPYLIIGSIKRRLILLKMTHGGTFSSNWIYPIENIGDTVSNIILDSPIIVGTDRIDSGCEYMYTLSRDLFIDIYQNYVASMLYISTLEREILSDGSIDKIKSIIDDHIDNMYSFSRYGLIGKPSNTTTELEESVDDSDLIKSPDVETIAEGLITEFNSTLNTAKESIDSSEESAEESVEESVNINVFDDEDTEDQEECLDEDEHVSSGRIRYTAKKDHIDVEDLVIFGEGFTKLDDINAAATEFDIKNFKFQLSDLCTRKKCTYINGKYNFVLKKLYRNGGASGKRNLKRYRSLIQNDLDMFGVSTASKIWGLSTSTIYYYAKKCNSNNRRDCV